MRICHECGAEFLPNCLRCSACGTPWDKSRSPENGTQAQPEQVMGETMLLSQFRACGITLQEIIQRHSGAVPILPENVRMGPTPSGGAYSILFRDGKRLEIVEFDASGNRIKSTIGMAR